jgi:UDP-N-acetylmuramate dehydrogenase
MNWQKNLKVRRNYPLKDKTTFKIAGPAEFFSEPKDIAQLKLLMSRARQNKVPVSIIGAGSNLLIKDKGLRGLLIRLSSAYFKKASFKNSYMQAGSGARLNQLIRSAGKRSLGGIEFLAGIPGTLGGALMMNAGCWGRSIGDLVEEVSVIDDEGKIKKLNRQEIKFGYRKSGLEKYIILAAVLKLKKASPKVLNRNIKDYILKRRSSQDLTLPSAGCIFKNPVSLSAARLIELSGLKGRENGDAIISSKHANFILNKGNAKAKDVLRLMRLIQTRVEKKFKVTLEPEIKIWG